MKIEYRITYKKDFNNIHRHMLANMLKKQGKVIGGLMSKIYKCEIVCFAYDGNDPIAVGVIKEKSDYPFSKAGVPKLSNKVDFELGHLYTEDGYTGKGVSSIICRKLIDASGKRLMATTEKTANPAMVKILEKNGFKFVGKPYKSMIHDNMLGLFLRY